MIAAFTVTSKIEGRVRVDHLLFHHVPEARKHAL